MGMRLQPESGPETQLTNWRLRCTSLESNLVLEAEGNGEVHHGIFIWYETLHCHHVLLRILGERKGGGEGEGESERGGDGEERRKGERREERRGGEREKETDRFGKCMEQGNFQLAIQVRP